ncbi:hypothetical protein DH2020_002069 [Rehmannia glutinosa]|uniref:Reverse transcriptase Ty1/copia-type domain-containing protein n=1 Tax=Rehmannia glutinosa TaxID=99300 RepID=A0ABR0XSM9_REHGL
MQLELEQFERNNVWDLVPRPEHSNVEGVDFDETFAPKSGLESIRLLLAFSCVLQIKLFQMDVKSAFLNGFLNEEVFVEKFSNGITIAQIYVDDIVFGSTSKQKLDEFVDYMSSEFEMSMVGELNYFLGLQVKQFDKGIFITQNKYAKNLVKRFGLDNKKHMKTPMGTNDKLSKDENGTPIDPTLYSKYDRSLLYLTASRPDISYSVCVCARYQSCPKESHLKAVKRIIRYINGTVDLGILYSFDTNTNLAGFSDLDWV